MVARFGAAFIAEGLRQCVPCYVVTTSDSPSGVLRRLGPEVIVLDARPGKRFADPALLEQTIIETARTSLGRFAIEGLDDFVRRLGPKRALGLFSRVCPQLFDLGSIAYWRAPAKSLHPSFLESVRRVTQCVLQIRGGQLRVLKAEGHRVPTERRLLRVALDESGTPRLRVERSLGRLAAGLSRLREQRHLTQAELAELAGVSASAISQAEAGHRGLSLDTVATLAERLQLSIDDLLGSQPDADYVLTRREQAGVGAAPAPSLDSPDVGLRAYLIQLAPGEAGVPRVPHKGVELVVVVSGVVQVDLGADMPVMRSGDAVRATRVAVAGWRNLLGEPARLFWILRD
jgi:transcriptional regulator with XRE-family HTH domain